MFNDLNFNVEDIKSHPEIVDYFNTLRRCEANWKNVVKETKITIANLKDRAKTLEVDYSRILAVSNLAKEWTLEDTYDLLLKAVTDTTNYVRFKKFCCECITKLKDVAKKRHHVKYLNKKAAYEAGKKIRDLGYSVMMIRRAYKEYKDKLDFLKDTSIKSENLERDTREYMFLNSIINAFVKFDIDKYWENKDAEDKEFIETSNFRSTNRKTLFKLWEHRDALVKYAESMAMQDRKNEQEKQYYVNMYNTIQTALRDGVLKNI